jgi:hypothetical protein
MGNLEPVACFSQEAVEYSFETFVDFKIRQVRVSETILNILTYCWIIQLLEEISMKYKLSDAANIAEIIGAVAIVFSLVFVGVQLKKNTVATRSASAIAVADSMSQWYSNLGSNEKNSNMFRNFMADPNSLSEEQRFQVIMNFHGVMLILQNNYYLANEGTLDPEVKDSISESIVVIKDSLGWKMYWRTRRALFLTGFQDYVDTLTSLDRKVSSEIYKSVDVIK